MKVKNFDDKPLSRILVGQMDAAPARQSERSPGKGTVLVYTSWNHGDAVGAGIGMMAPTNTMLQQLFGSVVQQYPNTLMPVSFKLKMKT